jgi:hypothetical protein
LSAYATKKYRSFVGAMPLLGMSVLEKYTLLELGRGACALRW